MVTVKKIEDLMAGLSIREKFNRVKTGCRIVVAKFNEPYEKYFQFVGKSDCVSYHLDNSSAIDLIGLRQGN